MTVVAGTFKTATANFMFVTLGPKWSVRRFFLVCLPVCTETHLNPSSNRVP